MEDQRDETESSVTTIQFRYSRSTDCRTVPVHGVYGGLSSGGMLFAQLYSEGAPLPERSEITIENGVPQPEKFVEAASAENVKLRTREVHTVIVLPIALARVLARWFDSKYDEWERLVKEAEAAEEEVDQ